MVGLLGKRCTVNGEINSHSVEVLWDTGAQVSIISNEFLKNFPGVVVKDISELLDTKLNLTTANGSKMSHIGWVELNFRLSSCNPDLKVPFLVTEQFLDSPLIAFKVAPYSFLTARELVSKSRDGASFKKSTRKSRATLTTASNSHWSNFGNHRCSFPMC